MDTILINGLPQSQLPVTDRGFQYGDGLFETISVIHGKPRLWERHLARLQLGCLRLNIPMPDSRLLHDEVVRVGQGAERCVVKLIVTRGSGGRGYRPPQPAMPTRVVIRYPFPDYPAANASEGVSLRLCETTLACNPRLAGIKHLNRLEQVLARSEWEGNEIAEGVMLDGEGNLIEGTMSNIFLIKEGVLHTPDLSRCGVAGIMRDLVLEQAVALQMPIKIGQLPAQLLAQAEELLITNSLIGIWPVSRCDDLHYQPGPVTRQLQQSLASLLEHEYA